MVELLELPVARGWRSPARARRRASPASRHRRRSRLRRRPSRSSPEPFGSPHPAASAWPLGLTDDLPVPLGGGVEPLEVAVGDPDDARVELVERGEVVVAEHALPDGAHRFEDAWVEDAVVGAGLEVHSAAGCEVAARRGACCAGSRAICSANAGRITSTTAACSARRTNRPRSESGGKSRTPCASIRGSSSSRRSIASCRSPGSSDSDSAMSCSIAQRLVCLAWSVSCSATPKSRRIARRSSAPAAIASRGPSSASASR